MKQLFLFMMLLFVSAFGNAQKVIQSETFVPEAAPEGQQKDLRYEKVKRLNSSL